MSKRSFNLLVLVTIIVTGIWAANLLAQGSAAASAVTTAPPKAGISDAILILEQLKVFIAACKTGDLLAALTVLLNIIVQMIKMPWVQAAFGKLVAKSKNWRLSPRGKIIMVVTLALMAGALWAYIAGNGWVRTILYSVFVAFAAMGARDFWCFVIRGETHSSKAVREVAA